MFTQSSGSSHVEGYLSVLLTSGEALPSGSELVWCLEQLLPGAEAGVILHCCTEVKPAHVLGTCLAV